MGPNLDQNARKAKRALTSNKTVAGASLVAAGALVWLSRNLFNDSGGETWQRVFAEGLLTVATGLALTVGIGTLLNQNRRSQERRAELAAFVEDQVVKLWDARSDVKRAAVLIGARRDLKTYDAQISELVDTRSSLMDVRGAVRRATGDTDFVFKDQGTFNKLLQEAVHALSRLIKEYHDAFSSLDDNWEEMQRLHCLGSLLGYGRKNADEVETDSSNTTDEIKDFDPASRPETDAQTEFDVNRNLLLPIALAATLLERTFEVHPRTG